MKQGKSHTSHPSCVRMKSIWNRFDRVEGWKVDPMKVRMRRPTHALQRVPFSRGPRWSCPWLARHLGGRRRPSSRSTLTLPTLGSTMSVIKSASNGRRKEAGRGYLSQGNTSKASRGHVDAPFFFFFGKTGQSCRNREFAQIEIVH